MSKQKLVKVRVAVAVDPDGYWSAIGVFDDMDGGSMDLANDSVGEGAARFWLTAELPIPEAVEVEAEVE